MFRQRPHLKIITLKMNKKLVKEERITHYHLG